jgi:hypothetical protein
MHYQEYWAKAREPYFIRNNFRIYYLFEKLSKQKDFSSPIKKKVFKNAVLYPTDYRKKNLAGEKLLINFLMQRGLFFKSKKKLQYVYSQLYNLLIFVNPIFLKKKYKFFETLGQIIIFNNYWFTFNNILCYFLHKIQPIFHIRCVSILKKFRKKKKALRIDPYQFSLKKLPAYKRFNYSVREFYSYIASQKRYLIIDKIFLGLLNLFMLDKKSFLYRKKIKIHRRVLNSYKSIKLYL